MKLVDTYITRSELKKMSSRTFGGLVKAVVDVKKKIMVVNADMHSDEEKYLLEKGSKQDDVWGINLYPNQKGEEFIEFNSMINIRPRLNNFTRGIDNYKLRSKITDIVISLVKT